MPRPAVTEMSGAAKDCGAEAGRVSSLSSRLARLIETECGAGSGVANLRPMEDGHAGLTFGFDVVKDSVEPLGSYVLKLAPIGIARRGNTDVYRQAPLLRGLKIAGIPVPGVRWASPHEDLLGTPFIIMDHLPGRIFLVWEPHSSFPRETPQLRAIWLQAAQMLARLHQVDWQTDLPDWERPRALKDELNAWTPLLRHAQTPAWATAGIELHGLLAAHMPDAHPIGVVHGDFQPGNILYVDGRPGALIDWELASIGSQGLDVGWLLMMSDDLAWHPTCRPVAPVSREHLVDAYGQAGGRALFNVDWYQALAHFRMGAIACLNVKLHRTGKRPDRFWESFAPSISVLFARGIELALRASNAPHTRRMT